MSHLDVATLALLEEAAPCIDYELCGHKRTGPCVCVYCRIVEVVAFNRAVVAEDVGLPRDE